MKHFSFKVEGGKKLIQTDNHLSSDTMILLTLTLQNAQNVQHKKQQQLLWQRQQQQQHLLLINLYILFL